MEDPRVPATAEWASSRAVGDVCLCWDKETRKHLPCEIKEVKTDQYFVHYIGFKAEYDEWVPNNLSRLYPMAVDQDLKRDALGPGDFVDFMYWVTGSWNAGEITGISPKGQLIITPTNPIPKRKVVKLERSSPLLATGFSRRGVVHAPPPPGGAVPSTAPSSAAGTPSSTPSAAAGGNTPATAQAGSQLDVLDTANNWLLADVMEVREEKLLIHYVGYSAKWDEWILRDSRRLAAKGTKCHRPRTGGRHGGYYGGGGYYPTHTPPKPTPVYLNWNTVMAEGLNDDERMQVDALMRECVLLKHNATKVLLGEMLKDSYMTTLEAFEGKVAALILSLPKSKYLMQGCQAFIRPIRAMLATDAHDKSRVAVGAAEDTFMAKLGKDFFFYTIPDDGNCLFGALGIGEYIARQLGAKPYTLEGALQELGKMSEETRATVTAEARRAVVEQLKTDHKEFDDQVTREVQLILNNSRAGRTGANPTSLAIAARLKTYTADTVTPEVAMRIYTEVMGSPGIFGTEIEIDAASKRYGKPIHVYHAQGDGQPHTMGLEFLGNTGIYLAFYFGKSHYNLLLRRTGDDGKVDTTSVIGTPAPAATATATATADAVAPVSSAATTTPAATATTATTPAAGAAGGAAGGAAVTDIPGTDAPAAGVTTADFDPSAGP